MKQNTFKEPSVTLLHATPLFLGEVAARTCYDSFDKSDCDFIRDKKYYGVCDVDESKLLDELVWSYHHESVIEHINLTFEIKMIPRSVLQELARHRLASYSVKSTRYTSSMLLYAFYIAYNTRRGIYLFKDLVELYNRDVFATINNTLDLDYVYLGLSHLVNKDKRTFEEKCFTKNHIEIIFSNDRIENKMDKLMNSKAKRNAGDYAKHVLVTENTSVSLIWTINLRSLKNFLKLRDSGAAWYPMEMLAKEIKLNIPEKYISLVDKKKRKTK
jgi:thymidylate synthase (FAD)